VDAGDHVWLGSFEYVEYLIPSMAFILLKIWNMVTALLGY